MDGNFEKFGVDVVTLSGACLGHFGTSDSKCVLRVWMEVLEFEENKRGKFGMIRAMILLRKYDRLLLII